MFLQALLILKNGAALGTGHLNFRSMRPDMDIQPMLCAALIAAYRTFVSLDARVHHHVFLQIESAEEILLALCALVAAVVGVPEHVVFQIFQSLERFAAHITQIRLQSRMDGHVSLN